jgi:hypothetical protein
MMIAMSDGDDLETRFNELVSQMDRDEVRRMKAAATRGVRSPRPAKPPAARRRGRRLLLATGLVFAVIGAGGVVVTLRPELLATLAPVGPVPDESIPVMAGPSGADPSESEDDLSEEVPAGVKIFQGTPAEKYATGAAGLVMPKAKALGGLSKKDVATALKRVRDLASAAWLDRPTLAGGKPAAFMNLIHPRQLPWFRKDLDLMKETKNRWNTRVMVNSFAPKTAEFVTGDIKVHGRTTLGTFRKGGARGVEVKLNYVVVYAVQRPGQPNTAIRLVTRTSGDVLAYRQGEELVVWLGSWGSSHAPARCAHDGFIHPSYRDSAPSTVSPTGPPFDPYDLDVEVARDAGCGASKKT